MSEEKRIEQEIGWYKILFTIFIAVDMSLLAWIAQNFKSIDTYLAILSIFAILLMSLSIIFVTRRVYKSLNRLEKL